MLKSLENLLFALVAFSSLGHGKSILLNGTAASVGKELITVQDTYIYRAIQRFKSGERPAVKIEVGEDLKRTAQKTAFEHMVYLELKSFEFETGTRAEAENEVRAIKKKGNSKEWSAITAKFQISDQKLTERLYRSLQVEHFMQKKVDTLTPIITEQEAEKFYQDNRARFKDSSYEQMKANIQVLLKKQHIQKGLEEWIQFLKEKYGFAILLEG